MKKVMTAPRTSTTPLAVPRTIRQHELRVLTSLPAGKMVPIAAIPLLREDAARVRLSMSFEMMETAELLINEVNVNLKAYLVPTLASERFTGMDDLNRSWEGRPARDGLPVTPFVEKIAAKAPGVDKIMTYLGKHAKEGSMINAAYHEAYNLIWNFRATNRSKNIAKRARLLDTLAPAFWLHSRFSHIVPDFDQAIMEGEVALSVSNARMPVKGLYTSTTQNPIPSATVRESGDTSAELVNNLHRVVVATPTGGETQLFVKSTTGVGATAFPDIYAELQQNGISVTLANLELARKTQAFAKLRQQFTGHTDDYIIDMLMDGLTVPEQAWTMPMLLQERSTIFGMSKRYATNGGDLTEGVVNGATMIDMNFAVPKCAVGGVIMIVAECTPDQLFERSRDPYLHIGTTEDFPHALRDMLDPEPVEAVRNDYIDTNHSASGATFGYAPMNHQWNFAAPCVGGRFFRPAANAAFDEDRQRIWAVETVDPVLSQDFYLCTTMHTKPFVNPNQDPFEVTAVGGAAITGNTQFGAALVEANGDYVDVMADAPKTRIVKPPA